LATSKANEMEQILDQLGSGEGLPVDAIRAANANRTAMVPLFLQAFDQAATASPSMQHALFFAFHLLGQWREKSAYRPLAAFLRAGEVEPILADAATETSHRVMASVFDGDPHPLYEVILDPGADEFIRASMFDALVIVTLRGELPREETAGFLESCYAGLQPQDECFAWQGWQAAIARLGLSELKPLVKQAFKRGFISPSWLGFKDFEWDLQTAIDIDPQPWQETDEFELFGDTIEELSDWAAFAPEDEEAHESGSAWNPPAPAPAFNPFRGVGRNDPCPCGSGKKFKKCCLDSQKLGKFPSPLHPTDPALEWSPAPAFPIGQTDEAITEYDPLDEPEPQLWLATDEQQRIDLVLAYHRRAGIRAPNDKVHAIIHVIIENQIADDKLPVRRTAQRLMSEGLDRHDAIHAIGSVVAGYISDLMGKTGSDSRLGEIKSGQDPNKAYFAELERLTAKAWLRSA
jgi:Protein of unknown function (DUF1186)/SEC-C motif